jgi:flagellar hook-associated protein 3 FlgL
MHQTDMSFQMGRREYNVSELQGKMAKGRRINNLRDDPLAAAQSARIQSSMTRQAQYQKNIGYAEGRYREVEGYMQEVMNIFHRLREIAVQAANGTYSQEERNYMAVETNELLNELVRISNTAGDSGIALFGGNDTKGDPFLLTEGRVPGMDHGVITSVIYTGSVEANPMRIADNSVIDGNFTGNKMFWAENQDIFGAVDATGYVVREDGVITVDGKEIALKQGDTVQTVITRINNSDTAVKASLDPVTNSLVLSTTTPHQIWIDEPAGQRILKDLGILSDTGGKPPTNLHPDALVAGGSLFDVAIGLRDNLLNGDYEAIGSQNLGSIDQGFDTLLKNVADLGAQTRRMEITATRLDKLTFDYTQTESRIADLDMTGAIMELQMYEATQKASYQVAGRILQSTLMDFLR